MADIVTKGAIELPSDVSSEIWAKTLEQNVITQVATRMDIPGNGLTIPMVTGEPEAAWVEETKLKPVSKHTLGTKNVRGYTLAFIEPFSNQFRRDYDALYNALIERAPRAIDKLINSTVLFGPAPGENFDTLAGVDTVGIGGEGTAAYDAFVDADLKVAEADGQLNNIILSPQGAAIALKAKDANGNPLFNRDLASSRSTGAILGNPVLRTKTAFKAGTPNIVGFAGDFTGMRYGYVEGLSISITDQATLSVGSGDAAETINLWQQNMFAVRVEATFGLCIRDAAQFVALTDAAAAAATAAAVAAKASK